MRRERDVLLIPDIEPQISRPNSHGTLEIIHVVAASAEHLAVERALDTAGIVLPMRHRASTVDALGQRGLFVAVRDRGRWITGVFLQERGVQAVPALSLWRIDAFGDAVPEHVREPVVRYVHNLARRRGVLRFNVGVFSRDHAVRSQLARIFESLGFSPTPADSYTRTLAVDLRPTETELLSSFSSSVRKRLREFDRLKVPVSLMPITDASLGPRMDELMKQTMARTGGRFVSVDWGPRIALAARNPHLCRIAGIVHGDLPGDEKLVAFVSGIHHGTHVQYAEGASARQLGRMPLMYPLVWDLIRWARASGAQWFDMGGVTRGSLGDGHDPLGGISDFKRRFSSDVIDVAEEWVLESKSLVGSLALGLNRVRHAIRDFAPLARRPRPAPSGSVVLT